MKKRLIDFLAYLGIGQTKFEEKVGLSRGFVNTLRDNVTIKTLNKIETVYPELNIDWLKTGEGDMLNMEKKRMAINKIDLHPEDVPLYNAVAAAGFGSFDTMLSEENIIDYYRVPLFKYCDFMMYVKGSSMYPKYSNGDIIACKILHSVQFLQWNKVYVIATSEQGFLVKRVKESDKDDCVCFVSDNKEYPPFDINKSEILGYALVVGVIRLE